MPQVVTTNQALDAEVARLRAEFFAEFGHSAAPLHTFAAPRRDGEQWQTNGRWFARKGDKTIRIKNPEATQPQPQEPARAARPEKPEPKPKPAKQTPPAAAPTSGEGTKPAGGTAHLEQAHKEAYLARVKAEGDATAAKDHHRSMRAAADQATADWKAARENGDAAAESHAAHGVKLYTAEAAKADTAATAAEIAASDAREKESKARQAVASAGGGKTPAIPEEMRAGSGDKSAAGPPPAAATPAATPAAAAPKGPGTKAEIRGQLGQRVVVPAGPVPKDAPPSDPARRAQAVNRGWNGRGLPPPPKAGATAPAPQSPPAMTAATPHPPAPKPPPAITPAEAAHLDAAQKADTEKYGARPAGILRRAAEALRGFLTLGGLVGGAYLGATVGTALGGPLGTALGTAVGGGLGGVAGSWTPAAVAKARQVVGGNGNKVFTPLARTRAKVRQAVRKVVPPAAGATVAGTGVGVATAAGAALGGVPGAMAGAGLGSIGSATPGSWYDTGADVAKGVRSRMATSAVSKRKAERDNGRKIFAEEVYPPPKNPRRRVKWKVPITPMPGGFHPAGGVGMFDEAAPDIGPLQREHDAASSAHVQAVSAYNAAKKRGDTMGPTHPAARRVEATGRRYANAANALHAAGGTPRPPKLPHAPRSPSFPKSMFGEVEKFGGWDGESGNRRLAALGAVNGLVFGGPIGAAIGAAAGYGVGHAVDAVYGRRSKSSAPKAPKAPKPPKAPSNFDEADGDGDDSLPPNAVAILKARLKVAAAKAGLSIPPVPDAVVAKALELAGEDADAADAGAAMDAVSGAVEKMAQASGGTPAPAVGMFTPGGRGRQTVMTFAGALPSERANVSPEKARKILKDGAIRGKPLSPRQRGLFGAIAGKGRK